MVDDADISGVGGEGGEVVPGPGTVRVVGHGVDEAADDGFCNICYCQLRGTALHQSDPRMGETDLYFSVA